MYFNTSESGVPMNGGAQEGGEVMLIADELSHAVELTLNPTASHESRNQAYNACESFKENSPWCAQAGLLLASGAQYSAVAKHFGLQLMEHTVKYRWTQITQAEKIFIKENAMKLLYMGGWEAGHLNDALARVIVEMIKREWPQQWPTLLAELSDACTRGHLHTQIVLHVFLRLVEDVATLQTLEQNQRRKDIYQALTSNMAEIFGFFMRLTELHVQEFKEKTGRGEYSGAASSGRVVQVVLQTLAGFVEWVSAAHVVADAGRLPHMLCLLLQERAFQLPAADCLLQILNRKGSVKERKPLLILFNEDAISCIHRAVVESVNKPDEEHYAFLKKLSQVTAALAALAAALWALAADAEPSLRALLQTLLLLLGQPSLTVAHAAAAAALALLKHDLLPRTPALRAAVPHWLAAAAPKLLKVSFPTAHSPPANDAATYACIDYDSENEFNVFFGRFRADLLDTFRYCMMAEPLVTWAHVEQWSQSALDKADAGSASADAGSALLAEWEALAQVVEVVAAGVVRCSPRPAAAAGLALLARVLRCRPAAADLRSLLLSLLSALVVFLSCASSQAAGPDVAAAAADLLPRVLDEVFAALVFEGCPPEDRRSRSVKNLRRHAASLLVKLGTKYPLLLLPVFGKLSDMCRAAAARPDLSVVESVTVQEALLLVANHLCCFERQSAVVAQVLGDSGARWEALAPHLGSPRALAALAGLDAPAAGDDDARAAARRQLLHAQSLLAAVLRRSQVPADPERAARGGFGGGLTPSGNPVWRNPCAAAALPLLPHALALLRSLHSLPAAGVLHATLAGAAGAGGAAARLGAWLGALHEAACAALGAAAGALGRALFAAGAAPQLALVLLPAPLPDAWLRRVLRHALKPLVAHCPPDLHNDFVLPLLEHVAPYMLEHLRARWEYITSLYEAGKLHEEAAESQEVLEDVAVRQLTRDYLDVLKVALLEPGAEPERDDEPSARAAEHASPLGALLLGSPRTAGALLGGVLRALTCPDSAASLRAGALLLPALRAARAQLAAPDAAAALAAQLQALTLHGQHDANQAALLASATATYELLRAEPAVRAVLQQLPGLDPRDLQRLDDKMARAAPTPRLDKTKRDLFKKIAASLIGRDLGQLFKKHVHIVDLPALAPPARAPPAAPALDAAGGARLDQLFAPDAPT